MSLGSDTRDPRWVAARIEFLRQRLGRRTLLRGALGAASGLVGARALRGSGALAAPAAQELPADAAPPEKQIFIGPGDISNAVVLDFYEQVYQRPGTADLFSDPLVRLTKNFEIIPAAAESWSPSEDGKTWTLLLDKNLVWSDGNPVTADDWVATFRYAADPAHAWDFTWFFADVLKNWNEAIAGTVPLDQLGVTKGADDYTLIFETVNPAPFLPAMLLYSLPLSKAALETTGPLYNTNPETAVSSGPFILSEWQRDQQITYVKNESYKGKLQVPVTKVVVKLAPLGTYFTLYEADEIDQMENPAPAELRIMQDDPELAKQIYSGVGDFRTFYIFFDHTKPPFDDIKVRQAFSHVIDRDAIQQQILGPLGSPAYSWLAPGFPASNREGLQEIQKFDPELGKQLLAEAGYPDGEGFPAQEMWLRNENTLNQTVAGAVASMLTEQLGIEVEVSNKDATLFMDNLTADPTNILFGYVSYGMDFLDPFNMLGVWLTTGRHSYASEAFDQKVNEAATFLGSTEERIALFQEAERILVSDVPGVFIYHATPVQLIKPWVRGAFLDPDENGITSLHWPGYTTMSTNPGELYITNEVPEGRS